MKDQSKFSKAQGWKVTIHRGAHSGDIFMHAAALGSWWEVAPGPTLPSGLTCQPLEDPATGRATNKETHLRQLDAALLTEMGKYQLVFLSSMETTKLKTIFKSQVLLGVVAEAGRRGVSPRQPGLHEILSQNKWSPHSLPSVLKGLRPAVRS